MIKADDIQRIRISGDPALEPLPASAYDEIVGQRAALDIAAGGLLTTESTTDAPMPPEGQSIVGISLTPAQVPGLPHARRRQGPDHRHPGRERRALRPAPHSSPRPRSSDTAIDETTGNTVVNVLVPYADASVLAARAATGNVALVLDSGSRVMADRLPDLRVRLARASPRLRSASRSAGHARCCSSRPTRPEAPASLPGFLRGTTPYDAGLIELALSPLSTADALRDVVRPLSPNVSLVAGTRSHAQAAALRDVWEPLVAALRDLDASGQDVIVDAGRLGLVGLADSRCSTPPT